jgi:hypothetical protein
MSRGQPVSKRNARLPRGTATEGAAFFKQRGPCRAMNGAVDASAAEQRGIRGIDNGIDVERDDVAVRDLQSIADFVDAHFRAKPARM